MSRWAAAIILTIVGLGLCGLGLQVPAHLRAVDGTVLKKSGANSPSLIDSGLQLTKEKHLGAAQMFATAAGNGWVPNWPQLATAVDDLARKQPGLTRFGRVEAGAIGSLFASASEPVAVAAANATTRGQPFTEFIVQSAPRTKALDLMRASGHPLELALLQVRSLTNTVLFPPATSASGQVLDTAIALAGLLVESGHVSHELTKELLARSADASAGNPQPLEQALLDLMSLGQRFNWGQLADFVATIKDAESLSALAELVQKGEGLPTLYSAVCLTEDAAGVAKYLTNFRETGILDLRQSLKYHAGGMRELLRRDKQLCNSPVCRQIAGWAERSKLLALGAAIVPRTEWLALTIKWIWYGLGGFCIAAAFHYARKVAPLERPLEVRGFHFAREFLFALGFLAVVLLLSEPFLAQGSQKVELPFRLQLPMVGGAAPTGIAGAPKTVMNTVTFLTMLLFFVLQTLLYLASLLKLAEIRRQQVPPHMKLKLLENEDHLFDAGLYLGFLGTIISLILVSLGVFKQPSLMAAYSSTSFGILFVVLFKVMNLRGARRRLILEAEAESSHVVAPVTPDPVALPL